MPLSERTAFLNQQSFRGGRPSTPLLLISVRNADELTAAIEGGAQIVDLKEPAHGALGCLQPEMLQRCLECHATLATDVPLSLAMGELIEWSHTWNDQQREILTLIRLNQRRIQFLKFGLSQCADAEFARRWEETTNRISAYVRDAESFVIGASPDARMDVEHPMMLIPAIYADSEKAGGPGPETVLQEAVRLGIMGLLIDTYAKDGTGLLGCLETARLAELRAETRRQHLFLALAGQIGAAHLSGVKALQPDVIGVRGVVCEAGNRTSILSQHLVASLRRQLTEA